MDRKIHKKDLKDLVEISRHYGKNKRAVIAGGGNTSMKTGEKLWVKASGHALETIDESGFAVLDRKKLQVISTREYSTDPFERSGTGSLSTFIPPWSTGSCAETGRRITFPRSSV
jgi:rhamnose utilization protein RhaD (predicted bifunctional aldolase and dehydrogenase)